MLRETAPRRKPFPAAGTRGSKYDGIHRSRPACFAMHEQSRIRTSSVPKRLNQCQPVRIRRRSQLSRCGVRQNGSHGAWQASPCAILLLSLIYLLFFSILFTSSIHLQTFDIHHRRCTSHRHLYPGRGLRQPCHTSSLRLIKRTIWTHEPREAPAPGYTNKRFSPFVFRPSARVD